MNEIRNIHEVYTLVNDCRVVGGSGCNLNRLKEAKESLDSHDLATAEKQYRTILESNPQEIEALAGLGWTYHLALKREEALSQFSYCLAIEPTNIECMRESRVSFLHKETRIRLGFGWTKR